MPFVQMGPCDICFNESNKYVYLIDVCDANKHMWKLKMVNMNVLNQQSIYYVNTSFFVIFYSHRISWSHGANTASYICRCNGLQCPLVRLSPSMQKTGHNVLGISLMVYDSC